MKEYKKNLTVFAGFYFKNALKARRRATAGKLVGACKLPTFPSCEIATAVSHRRQAGRRGYAVCRFYRGGFLHFAIAPVEMTSVYVTY